ncbi:MAG TPA: hypothetical protein VNJ01_00430 [Bacteriovoracaceae bacterium]|nr:hypothetical protein [Bacteriovoracaceae bacterium]
MKNYLIGSLVYMITLSAHSHPVIYQGGKVISSFNMASYSDNQALYSITSKWSAGLNHWRFTKKDKNTEMGLARVNHLLWRKNGEDSQANIYLLSGIGLVDSEIEARRTEEVYLGGFEADWETRTLFTALKYYHFTSPKVTDIFMAQGRIGFSPFESGFEDLQTWFMLQAMVMPDVEPNVIITPMLRFFYKSVLWEMGSSTRAEWMLNLMVHY